MTTIDIIMFTAPAWCAAIGGAVSLAHRAGARRRHLKACNAPFPT